MHSWVGFKKSKKKIILGWEQSCRDDIQSLGYVLAYLLRGNLPWQQITGNSRGERNHAILLKKLDTPASQLLEGYPEEFAILLEHGFKLDFEETPNYHLLKLLLSTMLPFLPKDGPSGSEAGHDSPIDLRSEGDSQGDGLSISEPKHAWRKETVCRNKSKLVNL